jgi:hypothetical protein
MGKRLGSPRATTARCDRVDNAASAQLHRTLQIREEHSDLLALFSDISRTLPQNSRGRQHLQARGGLVIHRQVCTWAGKVGEAEGSGRVSVITEIRDNLDEKGRRRE